MTGCQCLRSYPTVDNSNVSLIKTRCRASRRGEVFSPVGVRLPNPYENVHLCLEFAIYQTHVSILQLIGKSSCFAVFHPSLERRNFHSERFGKIFLNYTKVWTIFRVLEL